MMVGASYHGKGMHGDFITKQPANAAPCTLWPTNQPTDTDPTHQLADQLTDTDPTHQS